MRKRVLHLGRGFVYLLLLQELLSMPSSIAIGTAIGTASPFELVHRYDILL